MELKNRIKKILNDNKINPNTILDLGCKHMPYSDLFPNSKIIGFDIIQTMKLYLKQKENPNISFIFRNFNFNQEIPESDLVIASLFLHFLNLESKEKLLEQIRKSKYFLIVHLDKRVDLPEDFKLISKDEFDGKKEKHDGLPEHSHHFIIELYKTN